MNIVHITLVKALNELIAKYNDKVEGVNFVDIRNFEQYILSQGVNLEEVNAFLNLSKK